MIEIRQRAFRGISGIVIAGIMGCGGEKRTETSATVSFAESGHHGSGELAQHGVHGGAHPGPSVHGFNPHPGPGGICEGHAGEGSGGHAGGPGHGGAGGSTGMGGAAGGPAPMACIGTPVSSPIITDFSDAVAGPPIAFGTAPNLMGGTFSYAATGLVAPALSLTPASGGNAGKALQVTANPGATTDPANAYFGFGLYFSSCVDASAYSGVKFTIAGDLGNCGISFATTFSDAVSPNDDPRGACTLASCFPPSFPVTTTGTLVVPFASVSGGSPGTIDPKSIIGVQWQMNTPLGIACTANFTIADVELTNDAPPPPPPPPPPSVCTGFPPSTPLVFGSPSSPAGQFGLFTYAATGLAAPIVTPVTSPTDGSLQALQVAANPGTSSDPMNAFVGFGLGFGNPSCVDASAYTGVQFTVAGDLGTCQLLLQVISSENNTVPYGACTGTSCFGPFSGPLTTGTTVAHFADMLGGMPLPTLDPAALNDIAWNLNVPTDGVTAPCVASFTVSDVSFVTN